MAKEKIVRGYSRAFKSRGTTKRYMLDAIPASFWRSVRATARARGISMRALILGLLEDWMARCDAEDRAAVAAKQVGDGHASDDDGSQAGRQHLADNKGSSGVSAHRSGNAEALGAPEADRAREDRPDDALSKERIGEVRDGADGAGGRDGRYGLGGGQ